MACGTGTIPGPLSSARACPACAVALWAASEEPFAADTYCGADPPGGVRVVRGDAAVVFSASSAVNYYRGTSRMPAARYAGSLVAAAAEVTGCAAVAVSGQPRSLDAAALVSGPEPGYAAALSALVEPTSVVLDVRGMRERSFDVCIGTGPLPTERTNLVADAVARVCANRGLDVALNEPFAALPPWTVAHYSQVVLGVPAVQVQLSSSLRDPERHEVYAQVALTALRAAAEAALASR